jgi:hypothetical protein
MKNHIISPRLNLVFFLWKNKIIAPQFVSCLSLLSVPHTFALLLPPKRWDNLAGAADAQLIYFTRN